MYERTGRDRANCRIVDFGVLEKVPQTKKPLWLSCRVLNNDGLYHRKVIQPIRTFSLFVVKFAADSKIFLLIFSQTLDKEADA